jgi:hypothetical protein
VQARSGLVAGVGDELGENVMALAFHIREEKGTWKNLTWSSSLMDDLSRVHMASMVLMRVPLRWTGKLMKLLYLVKTLQKFSGRRAGRT